MAAEVEPNPKVPVCPPIPICGDGLINRAGEQCDDGNNLQCDGCAPGCTIERCGDGIICMNQGEACDPTGGIPGCQLCDGSCRLEPKCGDGVVDANCGEECDDGNATFCDGCSGCRIDRPGDGLLCQNQGERCDDGNATPCDGCTDGEPDRCGDGVLCPNHEQCDDGNVADGDGCSRQCTLPTPTRTATPSANTASPPFTPAATSSMTPTPPVPTPSPTITPPLATSVSGKAFGAFVDLLGLTLGETPLVVLPAAGGMEQANLLEIDFAPTLTTSTATVMTSGTAGISTATATSSATVEQLSALSGLITADALTAVSSSTCNGMTASSNATGSSLANLVVDGLVFPVLPPPNTMLIIPSVAIVTVNEQVFAGDGVDTSALTVNLVHVVLRPPVAGELIVASAQSGVDCAAGP
jgi:cysteine-rich repeat protein